MMGINAEFLKIPEAFLKAYQHDIMAWAANLEKYPTCEIRLVGMPGSGTILDAANVRETATLSATLWKHPISGETKIVVVPATDFDEEVIRLHVEKLPSILAAQRARAAAPKQVRAVGAEFDLPEIFVQAYNEELVEWGRELSKHGRCKHIVLRKIPGEPVALNAHGTENYFGVDLIAEVMRLTDDEVRLLIKPETEVSKMLIAKHCEAIERYGLPEPRRTVEQARKAAN